LPFRKPKMRATAMFGRNGNEHVDVIGPQSPFLDHTFFLFRQPMKHVFQVPPQHPIQEFLAGLRGEHDMVLAVPRAMIQLIRSWCQGRSPYVLLRAVEPFWEIFHDCKTLGFLQQSWRLSIWDSYAFTALPTLCHTMLKRETFPILRSCILVSPYKHLAEEGKGVCPSKEA
jgi:hypothetical protein